MKNQYMSIKERIEFRILPVLWLVAFLALMLRATVAWSGGAFNFDVLPTILQTFIFFVVGLAISGLMEILMSAAGARWYRLRASRLAIQFDTAYSEEERTAIVADISDKEKIALLFTVIGLSSSVLASMAFAFRDALHGGVFSTAIDIISAGLLAACLFYFGVIHEPEPEDHTKGVQEDAMHAVRGMLGNLGEQLKSGKFTNETITAIRKAVPKSFAPIMDSLIQPISENTIWTTKEIARRIGRDNPTGHTYVRRRMREVHETDSTYGTQVRATGRGLQMPAPQAFRLFQTDFEARLLSDMYLTSNGHEVATNPEFSRPDAQTFGHASDMLRTSTNQASDTEVSLSRDDYAA